MPTTCQTTHDWCRHLTWENNAWKLVWVPLIFQNVMALLMPAFSFLYKKTNFRIRRYEGLLGTTQVFQLVFSLIYACIWVDRTYRFKVDAATRTIEIILSLFFTVTYFINGAVFDFSFAYAWRLGSIIDVITVSSLLADPSFNTEQWLGWGFLRGYRALKAFERLEIVWLAPESKHRISFIGDGISTMSRAIMVFALRFLYVVVFFVGAVMTLEILGDPEYILERETTVTTDMGELSFAQMVYWMTTVMSTVGYGDFSPKTVLDRIFIIFAFVVGIIFFGQELEHIQSIQKMEGAGRSKYRPKPGTTRKHVVVIGGGVKRPGAILSSLLFELYDDEYFSRWPNTCLMADIEKPEELRSILVDGLHPRQAGRVNYFVGDCMIKEDMDRVDVQNASCTIVIPNIEVTNQTQEDEENIIRATAIKRAFPKQDVRLTLLLPESRTKALNCGIREDFCFSFNLLRGSILAQSCLCRGWGTMITNLLMSTNSLECYRPVSSKWFSDYHRGYGMEIYGLVVKKDFVEMQFATFAQKSLAKGVLPIAMQKHGLVVLNPVQYTCDQDSVIFAIAGSEGDLSFFQDESLDWQQVFLAGKQKRWFADYEGSPPAFANVIGRPADENGRPADNDGGASDAGSSQWVEPSAGKVTSMSNNSNAYIGPAEIERFDERAQKMIEDGGHIVLAMLSDDLWQQAYIFIEGLRSPSLPFIAPIVVLVKTSPSSELLEYIFKEPKFESVSFILGDPGTKPDLFRAGVHKAHQVVILSNGSAAKSRDEGIDDGFSVTSTTLTPGMADGPVVVAITSTEAVQMDYKKVIPVVAEFINEDSVRLLDALPAYVARKLNSEDVEDLEAELLDLNGLESECNVGGPEFFRHPRFAAGGLCVMNCLGSLVAATHYKPGILELAMNIIRAGDCRQESRPWQVKIPTLFAGRMYGELVAEFLKKWSALVLGIYRQRFPGITNAGGPGYVITNPVGSTVLQADDLVIVLGNVDFGSRWYSDGCLANTEPTWKPRAVRQGQNAEANQVQSIGQKSKAKKNEKPAAVKVGDDGKIADNADASAQDIGTPSKSAISQMKMQQSTTAVRNPRAKKKSVPSNS